MIRRKFHLKRFQTHATRVRYVLLFTFGTALMVGSAASAFDGSRKGFIIGGGVTDQITVSYTELQFWGRSGGNDVGFALLPSAEVRYFSSPDAPSAFGVLGAGPALYDDNSGN